MLTKSFKARQKVRVGEVLLQRGLINQAQLSQALAEQKQLGDQLGEILVQHGWVSHAQLQTALKEQRWRNVTATLLLSLSTLVPSATRLATHYPVVAQGNRVNSDEAQVNHHIKPEPIQTPRNSSPAKPITHDQQKSFMSLVGGAEAFDSEEPKPLQGHLLTQQPLHNNPTVDSPLQGFCHPLNGKGWLSQGIRGRTHRGRMEYAYDLAADIGTPVYAMRPGRVISVQDKYPDTGGGKENIAKFNYVWIEHDGGYRSAYIHLQQGFVRKVRIKSGDWVEAGQLIGFSGNSGWSTGPHLHLEVQKPGRSRRFTKTAPFAIAGTCSNDQIASRPSETATSFAQ